VAPVSTSGEVLKINFQGIGGEGTSTPLTFTLGNLNEGALAVTLQNGRIDLRSWPDLSLTKAHTGAFTAGTNGVYTLSVTNTGSAATTGAITLTDTLPAGLSYVSATGTDWSCSAAGQTVTCARAAALAAGAAAPAIALTVAVDRSAASEVTNTATVSTAGDTNAANDSADDPTQINHAPTADAGPDQTVKEQTLVTLDGSGSADPDGDALTYAWAQISGPAVTLSDPTAQKPTFTAPPVTGDSAPVASAAVGSGPVSSAAVTAASGTAEAAAPGHLTAWGDFDQDGRADLATAAPGDTRVTVRIGYRQGSFEWLSVYEAPGPVARLAAGRGRGGAWLAVVTESGQTERLALDAGGRLRAVAGGAGAAPLGSPADLEGDDVEELSAGGAAAAQANGLRARAASAASAVLEFELTVSDGVLSSAPDTVRVTVESALIFSDGFESGDTSKWSSKKP
jgi:uncharacterized repeat protein (TIGR01451 family)